MSDPEELDPEVDVDLSDDLDDDEDAVPDGFVVEGEDDTDDGTDEDGADGADADEDGDVDEGSTRTVDGDDDPPDDFADDVAPVVRVPEEEDDAPARQSGEFVCTRCFLVKKESQLAVRTRKVCRDCA